MVPGLTLSVKWCQLSVPSVTTRQENRPASRLVTAYTSRWCWSLTRYISCRSPGSSTTPSRSQCVSADRHTDRRSYTHSGEANTNSYIQTNICTGMLPKQVINNARLHIRGRTYMKRPAHSLARRVEKKSEGKRLHKSSIVKSYGHAHL